MAGLVTRLIHGLESARAGELPLLMDELLILLKIAEKPGKSAVEYAQDMGMAQQTFSKRAVFLAHGRHDEPGKGLIETVEDAQDARRKGYYLTAAGKRLAMTVLQAIDDHAEEPDGVTTTARRTR